MVWLVGENGMYVSNFHGAVFVTWVVERHRSIAMTFPRDEVEWWSGLIFNRTGIKVVAVEVSEIDERRRRIE